MKIEMIPFGTHTDGEEITCCRIANERGMQVEILSLGGIIHRLIVPDARGNLADIVLGQPDVASLARPVCDAVFIGRCANRIRRGRYALGEKVVELEKNMGEDMLHSGSGCYGVRSFVMEPIDMGVRLTLLDAGWAGFPGDVQVAVSYLLDEENRLYIEYEATPDEETPINFTNHAYFNLAGHGSGRVDAQEVQMLADFYLPCDERGFPTGEVRTVADTPVDLRTPRALREGIASGGYDIPYCIAGRGMRKAAIAWDPASGRRMTAYTDMPNVQLYTANSFPSGIGGKEGAIYGAHHGFCLETQQYPDAVNLSQFPSPFVRTGERFRSTTIYAFDTAARCGE